MRNLFLILVFWGSYCFSFAQKVNYEEIQFQVQNPNSDYFYERLFPRYLVNDSSLTLKEYHYLYYGYAFDEDYDPNYIAAEKLEIRKYLSQPKMKLDDYLAVIGLSKAILTQMPFDTEALFLLQSCYEILGNFSDARIYRVKLNQILAVIYKSGDAQSKNTAMYILYPNDGKMLARKMGFYPFEEKLVQACDYLRVKRNNQKIKGLYFNIDPLFQYRRVAGLQYSKR